jgi:hypothetical protein
MHAQRKAVQLKNLKKLDSSSQWPESYPKPFVSFLLIYLSIGYPRSRAATSLVKKDPVPFLCWEKTTSRCQPSVLQFELTRRF